MKFNSDDLYASLPEINVTNLYPTREVELFLHQKISEGYEIKKHDNIKVSQHFIDSTNREGTLKTLLISQPEINDGLVGITLNHISNNPCFVKVEGMYLTTYNETQSLVIIMEEVGDSFLEQCENINDVLIGFLYLMNAFVEVQKYRYSHNSLHMDTILYKHVNTMPILKGITILHKIPFIPVIVDNDHATISTDTFILEGDEHRHFDYYKNPLYLFANLLPLENNKVIDDLFKMLLPEVNDYRKLYLQNNYDVWYPNYPLLYKEKINTQEHVLEQLVNYCMKRRLISGDMKISSNIFNWQGYLTTEFSSKMYSIGTYKLEKYKGTVCKIMLDVAKELGYGFSSACCDISLAMEVDNRDGEVIGINGNYFNIYYSNYPIFTSRTYAKDIVIDHNEEPEEYYDTHYWIGILPDRIKISDKITDRDYSGFMSNSVLLKDGIKMIDHLDKVTTTDPITYIYKCVNLPPKSNKWKWNYNTKVRVVNCDNISPGTLFHYGQYNPRSLIAWNDTTCYFITVDGRKTNYPGADILDLYTILDLLAPGVTNAVNLDGGQSSEIVYKGKDGKLFTSKEFYSNYPIGNAIIFSKL